MIYDLIIVGGGASGTSAAIAYKRKHPNNKVLILEKNEELLKKVNASGNGKGNFTNDILDSDSYNSKNFVSTIFKENPKEDVLGFFDSLGMKYYMDKEGRYYPNSSSAKTISYVIKRELEKLNVEIKLNFNVNRVTKEDNLFIISDSKDEYKAKALIISTGAKNYASLGGDEGVYSLAESLGHHITNLYPANIYIEVKEKDITKRLSGLRFDATLYLMNAGEIYYHEKGEVLFKDNAISGIVTFNVSNRLAYLYKTGAVKDAKLIIDFCNKIDTDEIVNMIYQSKDVKETLMGLVHPTLAQLITDISNDKKEILINLLSLPFSVKSLGDFEHAQATAGGVKVIEIKDTLESIFVDNLYFTGDILDVDAASGGYNLSFAFLSGIKAGESVE